MKAQAARFVCVKAADGISHRQDAMWILIC